MKADLSPVIVYAVYKLGDSDDRTELPVVQFRTHFTPDGVSHDDIAFVADPAGPGLVPAHQVTSCGKFVGLRGTNMEQERGETLNDTLTRLQPMIAAVIQGMTKPTKVQVEPAARPVSAPDPLELVDTALRTAEKMFDEKLDVDAIYPVANSHLDFRTRKMVAALSPEDVADVVPKLLAFKTGDSPRQKALVELVLQLHAKVVEDMAGIVHTYHVTTVAQSDIVIAALRPTLDATFRDWTIEHDYLPHGIDCTVVVYDDVRPTPEQKAEVKRLVDAALASG